MNIPCALLSGCCAEQVAAAGEWTVKFGVEETAKHGQGYAEIKVTAH